ncbi:MULTISPECIES: ABC transporter ATP-binding protein [unclassified Phaeobacter]|uniref:ABC transporter ATP-binding protein n=1 Tax=unclassified Phaeobacter TaxID=2621772 RepID=UPI003A844657
MAKRFGAVHAVSSIDLDVAPGEALGLLGPNGAGKSTTLSMLMGLRRPDGGEALVFGHAAGSPAARALTGATPQSTGFPDQLSPREILTYTAARYGVQPKTDDLVASFGLEKLIDRRVAGFSGGEMRRVALALAFVGSPKLVFLDEPTTGLDSAAQDGFHEIARDYIAKGGALVLTSHHWDEIEAICDTIALIDQGETVLSGRIGDMRARATVNRLSFALPTNTLPPEWLQATHDGHRWHVETSESDVVLRRIVEAELPFHELTLQPLDLKDLINRIREEEIAR